MKKCSPSLAIKEMQIKTIVRFRFTPVRMAVIKDTNNNTCPKMWQVEGTPNTLLVGMYISATVMESTGEAPQKVKTWLPYDPVRSLLSTYLKEWKSGYNKDTGTPMFTAALLQ
jgi:hypothetical protein